MERSSVEDAAANALQSTRKPEGLGADVRALRRTRGLTLAALAAQVGKSVGWLSQVERGISRPGIDDLRLLAAALDVPLSLFFGKAPATGPEAGRIVRAGSRRQLGGDAPGLSEELLSPDLTDDFEVLRSSFAPGARLGRTVERPTQEVGYVVAGRLELEIGGHKFTVGPGDSFRIRGEPFAWANPHDETAVVIWVIAPPVY
ncbi:MAG: XRE family transcriptional regulator [Alphaproteobacteria bacterium]|nr:MAG: XRE family transcriptional regulator [Alphaproteobacteria bacterium]